MNMCRILLIGPTTSPSGKTGGTVVSFNHLVNAAEQAFKSVQVFNIGTSKPAVIRIVSLLAFLIRRRRTYDVVWLNSNYKGLRFISPLLYVMCIIFRKIYVFRMFGGALIEYYNKFSKIERWIHKNTTFKADLLLLQTIRIVNWATRHFNAEKVHWYPTARPAPKFLIKKSTYSKRIIFLGRLVEEKGVRDLLWLAENLSKDYTLHIYGPIGDNFSKKNLAGHSNYKGEIPSLVVLKTLYEYDLLLLPTHYSGEGYPGVIIEALSVGTPCITTNWKSIPDLIQSGENGFLFNPKDKEAMKQSILKVEKNNYGVLSKNATLSFKKFELSKVNAMIFNKILEQLHDSKHA